MKLIKMIVNNYRQFERAEIDFDNNITVLAGANNSGKTSLISLIKRIVGDSRVAYSEADIPTQNMKEWLDKAYPLFKDFFETNGSVDEIESGLFNKMFPKDESEEEILLKTTEVYIQVDYDIENDSIKLFADYIMDLDDAQHSFYFIYAYEINKTIFRRKLTDNFEKIKRRFDELRKSETELKKRHLQELLVRQYIESIKPVCYFCDKNYDNKYQMNNIDEFEKLFNFNYVMAGRPLDDEESDHLHTLSKKMVAMAKLDDDWNDLIALLPDELIKPIESHNIDERVREASLKSLKDTIEAVENTNGGESGKLMLDMNITEEAINELLERITTTTYNVNGYYLGESSQGLGYSNMIYMHLQLKKFEKGLDPLKVNMFFVEEPESHMHPQMQQVFIKYLLDYYRKQDIQGVVTTHSNEMVRVAGISHLRVIRKIGNFKSNLYNLALLTNELRKSGEKDDEELANFFDWFFEIGYSEIVFADKAILYEGDTERLLIRKLLTEEKYEALSKQYIAYIQVGGAYAYKYRKLLDLLKIKTLIITDLDYSKQALEPNEIKQAEITNATIKNFYKETHSDNPTVEQLYKWQKDKENILCNGLINLSYQSENDHYARTLEEAMLGKYFDIDVAGKFKRSAWIKMKEDSKLKFVIPNNKKGENDSEISLRDILESTSGEKTDFMYSVILEKLVIKMEPQYISEGLAWLME